MIWLVLAALVALIGVPNAEAGIHDRLTPLTRVNTFCQDVKPDYYGAWFDSGPPPWIALDEYHVCRPIRRLWNRGFPDDAHRRWQLGNAIFIVSHEEQHVEQWEAGRGLNEQEADCGGAWEFRPWARKVGVVHRWQRRRLQTLIARPYVSVGYSTTNWSGCWRWWAT